MRFRELLTILSEKLQEGERAYAQLFSAFSEAEMKGVKEKDLQWKLAEYLVDDLSPLSRAVLQLRFDTREMGRSFEELYDVIVSPSNPE